jgi:hypothetical protein
MTIWRFVKSIHNSWPLSLHFHRKSIPFSYSRHLQKNNPLLILFSHLLLISSPKRSPPLFFVCVNIWSCPLNAIHSTHLFIDMTNFTIFVWECAYQAPRYVFPHSILSVFPLSQIQTFFSRTLFSISWISLEARH